MAEKRMFSKQITRSDAFLDMPRSTRLLYYDLSLDADDDGFLDKFKSVMRLTGASEDDLKLLIAKSFIIPFENGIMVIKHWRINNIIRNDRYRPTAYQDLKNQLILKENGSYSLKKTEVGIPTGYQVDTKWIPMVCVDKNSIGKDRLDKDSIEVIGEQVATLSKRFKKPTIEEIRAYCEERKNGIDAEQFFHFYESKKWMIGKDPMSNWKSAVITWEKRKKSDVNTLTSKAAEPSKYIREE